MDPRTEKLLAERAQKIAATPAPLRGPIRVLESAQFWAKAHVREAKILAGALVAVLVGAYYLGVALPAQRAERLETEAYAAAKLRDKTTSRQTSMSECLTKAETEANDRWTAACKARREGPNCPLPEKQAEDFDRTERTARNACLMNQ